MDPDEDRGRSTLGRGHGLMSVTAERRAVLSDALFDDAVAPNALHAQQTAVSSFGVAARHRHMGATRVISGASELR
jgi:hypothetical protein